MDIYLLARFISSAKVSISNVFAYFSITKISICNAKVSIAQVRIATQKKVLPTLVPIINQAINFTTYMLTLKPIYKETENVYIFKTVFT